MAIVLDRRALEIRAHRRAHSQDDRIFLRLERCSIRAGAPWVVVAGWAPPHWPDYALVLRRAEGVEIHVEPRLARYAQWNDLTISGTHMGPWRWLSLADPFAYEHMREWEHTRPELPIPPASELESVKREVEIDAWLPDAS
jgi:hypothetical protein